MLFAPTSIAAALLASVGVRAGWATLCFAAFLVACVFGIGTVVVVCSPEALLEPWTMGANGSLTVVIALMIAIWAGILTTPSFAAMIAAYWLKRWLGRGVLRQTGLLCWTCGYNLGATSITTCPECGTRFTPNDHPRSRLFALFASVRRAGTALLIVSALLALLPLGWVLVTHTMPSIAFLRALPANAHIVRAFIPLYQQAQLLPRVLAEPLSHAWFIPDQAASSVGYVVQFVPGTDKKSPCAYVSRANLDSFIPSMSMELAIEGTSLVRAVLNCEQTKSIIRNKEVPGGLLLAIRELADSEGWKERAWSTPGSPSGPKDIDAATYFAAPPVSNP